jgi:hypothetical protein
VLLAERRALRARVYQLVLRAKSFAWASTQGFSARGFFSILVYNTIRCAEENLQIHSLTYFYRRTVLL